MMVNGQYNCIVMERVESLLQKKKTFYLVDLHIHTNHSVDGTQTVEAAINRTNELNFDIISIADHDSIDAYKEIQLFNLDKYPVIIPGVEFTVHYSEYGEKCHILKYFYTQSDIAFSNILEQNRNANWQRAKLQFEQIKKNKCLQFFFNKYNLSCTFEGYQEFLKNHRSHLPEYASLIDYIYSILSEKNIGVWDIYYKTLETNESDPCEVRRTKKMGKLTRFYSKYQGQDIQKKARKLLPILATTDVVDADYPEYESSGNLSVLEYGQVTIAQLKNNGLNVFAHPNENKLDLIDSLKGIISGLELNYRSTDNANQMVAQKVTQLKFIKTLGSDIHSLEDPFYNNLGFYKMTYEELRSLYQCMYKVT